MKNVMIIPDGMADYKVPALNGKTPVEVANTPNLDEISLKGKLGTIRTTPQGFSPGSDICILSLLGFDPFVYYSGRAPLEAVSLGIDLKKTDLVLRCNLIHTSPDGRIMDHSAGHITSDEAKVIIEDISCKLGNDKICFYPGISYRNILVCENKNDFECKMHPPHDIPGELYKDFMPQGKDAAFLNDLMIKSRVLLENHPVNMERRRQNKPTADMIWLWGSGYKPEMPKFKEKYSTNAAVISAVDLIKGLAILLDLKRIEVPDITGHFDTNYKGKGEYAIEALKDNDLVIIHIEAPDEAGHVGDCNEKIKAIENIDKYIIGPVFESLQKYGDFNLLITPDHYTPVTVRKHVANPVPFVLCGKNIKSEGILYSERNANESNWFYSKGFELMGDFLKTDKIDF